VTVRETCAPEGASRSWNHGRGTRVVGLKRLRACGAFNLVFLRVRGCGAPQTDGRSGHGNVSRPACPKGLRRREPQERQRTQRVRKAGGRGTRRGGERPRGRKVPGVANPGDTDPSADVAEGARTPGGATRSMQDRGGHRGPNPERETKPVGAAGRSSDRTDGRTAEFLVVVETTWRRRRTNDAATPDGALREAGQP